MIVHDYKLIFIHIPKCAGRSICSSFNQRFDHFTANYYVREYGEYWNSYDKFTVVRNPYDRLVSVYHYIKEHRRHINEPIGFNGRMPDFKTWLIENVKHYNGDFYKNSAEGMRGSDGDLGSSFWFSSQARRLSDNSGILYKNIHIIPFEAGISAVEEYLYSITDKRITLFQENKSNHLEYMYYYDEESVSILSNFEPVLEDLNKLNYKSIQYELINAV